MKKALVILLALAMVFGVFADDLAAVTIKGDATLSWTYDLDESKYGMGNASGEAQEYTIQLVTKDIAKSTEGSGIWGELVVKSTEAKIDQGGLTSSAAATLDVAKIHFGDTIAVSIKAPNLEIGGIGASYATNASLTTAMAKPNAAPENAAGFTVEIALPEIANINVAFADNGVAKEKDYGFKVDADVKAVENLTLKLAANYNDDFAAAAEFGYKLGLGDPLFVKPAAGVLYTDKLDWVAGVLFGWGADGQEPGLDFVADKCANGFSVAANSAKEIVIGAFDNTLVDGLAMGADYVAGFDTIGKGTAQVGAKYSTSFGDFGFAAHAGFKTTLGTDNSTDYKYGVSVDNKTFIQNTTLSVGYEGGKDIKGKITAAAKIAF